MCFCLRIRKIIFELSLIPLLTWSSVLTEQHDAYPVLKIRRGNWDNFLNNSSIYCDWNCLAETILMMGHNICFC